VTAALAPRAIFDDGDWPGTFYTWTTDEQAEELRRDRVLLRRGAADGAGMSAYNGMLWSLYGADPVARLLLNPPFHLVRYAWPFPWATRLGGDDRPYGDRLVRIDLREDALLARFRSQAADPLDRWAFFDRHHRRLSTEEFLARAADLAVVYHARHAPSFGLSFREFIVVNEAKVLEWSVGTDEINAAIDADRATIGLLARLVAEQPEWSATAPEADWNAAVVEHAWGARPPQLTPELAYAAGLAFANARYLPGTGQIDVLLRSLLAARQPGPPLHHEPPARARPRALRPPPPLPGAQPPDCVPGDGTFDCGAGASQVNLCRDPAGFVRRCPRIAGSSPAP
jgi:hypothetical protein